MKKIKTTVSVLLIAALLHGCAGVGIFATSDPQVKLSDARHLFMVQDRPVPAERLIIQAIAICEEKADINCLAEAYWSYSLFFQSNAVKHWEKAYRDNGFYDRTVKFDDRFEKAKEYFEKARPLIEKSTAYDLQTNMYLNSGFDKERSGLKTEACEMYAKSLAANQKNLKFNPDAKVSIPDGYSTFAEYLSVHKKRAECIE